MVWRLILSLCSRIVWPLSAAGLSGALLGRERPWRQGSPRANQPNFERWPEDIDARTEAGHWEGDLIICKRTRPVLVLHERKSRVTLAARLTRKTAAETISVMLAVFGRINPALRKSITFDNDTAFAQHALLRAIRDMATWFCRHLRLLAERRCRKRQWSITTLAAASHRHRSTVRRGNPGHRHNRQSHAEKMLGLQDAVPRDSQRAWQRRPNSVFIDPLHLAPEFYERRLRQLV